ncbi:MAG TPA: hypothetical protein VET30_09265 [Pseudoxanthomonas sp.]|nr:hypothetical protein [Pseudoxanthomonas sp.]
MKVSDLIAKLSALPPELDVFCMAAFDGTIAEASGPRVLEIEGIAQSSILLHRGHDRAMHMLFDVARGRRVALFTIVNDL